MDRDEELREETLKLAYKEYLQFTMGVVDLEYNVLPFNEFKDSGIGDYVIFKTVISFDTAIAAAKYFMEGEEDDTERSDPEIH